MKNAVATHLLTALSVEFVPGCSKGAMCDSCIESHNPNWTMTRIMWSSEQTHMLYCPKCVYRLSAVWSQAAPEKVAGGAPSWVGGARGVPAVIPEGE